MFITPHCLSHRSLLIGATHKAAILQRSAAGLVATLGVAGASGFVGWMSFEPLTNMDWLQTMPKMEKIVQQYNIQSGIVCDMRHVNWGLELQIVDGKRIVAESAPPGMTS